MSTTPSHANPKDLRPRLTVVGVGGAGCNAINNMIDLGLEGVDFVVANTDAQSLVNSRAQYRIQLGVNLTEGLGAGAKPDIGEAAAVEALEDIRRQLAGAHMVFIAVGMGGGTGTGAASVIARAAKEMDILTVGVVTKPFQFEGGRRMRIAEAGIEELKKHVDTLIVIPNQNLFRVATEKTTFAGAFAMADQVLHSAVACIVHLIVRDGLINLDFADVRTIMSGMGTAMMGTGEAAGERRAIAAAEAAILNPLLDDVSLNGAKGLLLLISGNADLTLYEVDEAASRVRSEVEADANIIVGATFDPSLGDRVRVSLVASGMNRAADVRPRTATESAADTSRRPQADKGAPGAKTPREAGGGMSPSSAQARRPWHGPDDVFIEDSPPHLMPPALPRLDPLAAPRSAGADQDSRIPPLDDFPLIGQLAYRGRGGSARESTRSPGPATATSVSSPPRQGAGFFKFLAGMTGVGDSRARPMKNETHQQAAAPSRRLSETSGPPGREGLERVAHAPDDLQQVPEAPAFLRRDRA